MSASVDIERTANVWRMSLADGDHAALFIRQAIRFGDKPLARHIRQYLSAVRQASECEERLTAEGVPLKRRPRS